MLVVFAAVGTEAPPAAENIRPVAGTAKLSFDWITGWTNLAKGTSAYRCQLDELYRGEARPQSLRRSSLIGFASGAKSSFLARLHFACCLFCELSDHSQPMGEVTLNCAKLSKFWVIAVSITSAIVIGYFNQTDVYSRLNSLPSDRNELTPIRATSAAIVNGSTLVATVIVRVINEITFVNLYEHVTAKVTAPGGATFELSASTGRPFRTSTSFQFSRSVSAPGRYAVQFQLFGCPFNLPCYTDKI
jgi:hypothetical protein